MFSCESEDILNNKASSILQEIPSHDERKLVKKARRDNCLGEPKEEDEKEAEEILKAYLDKGKKILTARGKNIKKSKVPLSKSVPGKRELKRRRQYLRCSYCKKKGHKEYFCASKINRGKSHHSEEEKEFIDHLMKAKRKDVSEYKTIEDWLGEGERLNRGNPWLTKGKEEDQSHATRLKGHLGFWRAAGATNTVLS